MKLGLFSGESRLRGRLGGESGVAIDPKRKCSPAMRQAKRDWLHVVVRPKAFFTRAWIKN